MENIRKLYRRNAIKISELLRKLLIPLAGLAIFFIVTTFLANFAGNEEFRVFQVNWQRVLQLLDLREENTVATWFSSILFLVVSLAFLLLGWSTTPQFVISQQARWWFRLSAIGACLISADEVASVHETVGKWFARFMHQQSDTPVDEKGFSWILLFAPPALFVFSIMVYHLFQTLKTLPREKRQYAQFALVTAFLSLPSVFGFELLEAYFTYTQPTRTVFPCFEEAAEVVGMYSLFLCAVLIANHYEL